jgi:hypothetical protein
LEEIGTYYHAASVITKNLKVIWESRGSYWEVTEKISLDRAKMEGVDD